MDNVLDILCDYSKRNKEVDTKFLKYVFKTLKNDNGEYVRKIKCREFFNTNNKVHTPMSYSYFAKTIYYHPNEIEGICNLLKSVMESKNWSDLNRIFLINTIILFDLLHEFEHVYQFDKVLKPYASVESKLLRLTHLLFVLIDRESSLSKFFIRNMSLLFNDNIRDIYIKQGTFNKAFGTEILYERLADIHACEKINNMLDQVDLDIGAVKNYFAIDFVQHLLHGYDEKNPIPYPMVRYIKEIKVLNIPEIDEYITNVVMPTILEVTKGYERFMYGLYVTDEEIKDLKKNLL